MQIFDYFEKKPDLVLAHFENVCGSLNYHFRISDQTTGLHGEGSATDMELAQNKAFSELVERTVFYRGGARVSATYRTTNGFAAHPDRSCAVNASVAELLERDLFLSKWLAKSNPNWLSSVELQKLIDLQSKNEIQRLNLAGFEISVGRLGSIGGQYHALTACLSPYDRSFAAIVVSACAECEVKAIATLLLNLDRALAHVISNYRSSTSRPHASLACPQDHMDFYVSPESRPAIQSFLSQGASASTALPEIDIEIWDVPLWNGQKTYVAAASSNSTQGYFVGCPKLDNVNRARLRNFITSTPFKINRTPHPLS